VEANAVEIWRVDLDAAPAPPPGLLSAAEAERAAGIRDPAAARRWAASRWALRELLGRRLGVAAGAVELALGEHGKPRLAAGGPEFNLSHSGALALVALAAGPVGVDVEEVKSRATDLGALAARVLDPEEAAAIARAKPEERPALFFPAWARHEARLKCWGGGFGGPAPGPVAVADLDLGPGFAGAVALAGTEPPAVGLYRLDLR
jgi:4'-phosphopantetheinyl transferase